MARTRNPDPHEDPDDGPEERVPRRRPAGDGGNVAVKIVAILGAVVLGLAVICSGTVAFLWYLTTRTVATVSQNVPKEVKDLVVQPNAPEGGAGPLNWAGRVEQIQPVVEGFVNDLRGKNFDRAYQATSKAYQARTSRKAFEDYVVQRPAITSPNATLLPANLDVGGGKRISFQLTDLDAVLAHDVRLDVVEEDGGWKIDSLEAN
jgi:hypothetical protein